MFYNKCPRCHKGDVFKHQNPYRLKGIFDMHKECPNCRLLYEREPGFFFGAMFISYILIAGWFMIWYAIEIFSLHWDLLIFALAMGISGILLSPLTFRWSRLIWLNFFYSYKKGL